MVKLIIFLLVILIIVSLGVSLFFMIKDRGNSTRNVKSLSIRIGIWVVLLLFMFVAYQMGYLKPSNSINNYHENRLNDPQIQQNN